MVVVDCRTEAVAGAAEGALARASEPRRVVVVDGRTETAAGAAEGALTPSSGRDQRSYRSSNRGSRNSQRGHPGAGQRHFGEPGLGLESGGRGKNMLTRKSTTGLPGALRELLVEVFARVRRRQSSFMEGGERRNTPQLERR